MRLSFANILARLVGHFKYSFSVFKQYYTHFYTFFYLHIFQKITNNITQTPLPNGFLKYKIFIWKVSIIFFFFEVHCTSRLS